MNFVALFFIFVIVLPSGQSASSVGVSVVEYHPLSNPLWSSKTRVETNAAKYIELMQKHSLLNLIVFPEDTLLADLSTATPVDFNNPCDDAKYPNYMRNLSCAARNSKIYLVINVVETAKCDNDANSDNCRHFGFYFYNTDVVFNSDGKIISRYRKYNLFGEKDRDKPTIAERVVVTTNFGIKFGIFTCFDILFKTPTQDLVDIDHVDHFVFPTMWFSELPFLTALQTQQMWSQRHNVTLYASGANNPLVGSGGTGIYNGAEGPLLSDIRTDGQSGIYTNVQFQSPSDDNIDILAKQMDGFKLISDPSLPDYNSSILVPSLTSTIHQVCHGELCCNFSVQTSLNSSINLENSYVYHLVAYSGVRSFSGVYNGGIEVCGIIACLNTSLTSCGRRFPNYDDVNWPLTFDSITISAYFDKSDNKTQYPNSLLSSIRPLPTQYTKWMQKENELHGVRKIETTFKLTHPQNRLLTFAIYGRNFVLDAPPLPSDGHTVKSAIFNLIVFAILLIF